MLCRAQWIHRHASHNDYRKADVALYLVDLFYFAEIHVYTVLGEPIVFFSQFPFDALETVCQLSHAF